MTKHKHKWYLALDGITFLKCDCGEVKVIDVKKEQKIYIVIE